MLNLQLIKQLQQERGLSASALAQLCGVSKEAVSNWLRGESVPRPSKWAALAAALGQEVQELVLNYPPPLPEPLVAFSGQRRVPPSQEAREIAQDMGRQLRQMLPLMAPVYSARQLADPTLEANYVERVVQGLRTQLGVPKTEPLSRKQLLQLLKDFAVIPVPVYWEPPCSAGERTEGFETVVSIYLPDSRTVWALINVGGPTEHVNYGLAHALGHCLTLSSLSEQGGDTFADMFARALLSTNGESVKGAPKDKSGPFHRATSERDTLFTGTRPCMRDLVHQGETILGSPVFRALAQWQKIEGGRSPAFISAALNMGLGDAISLSYEVMEL